MQFAIVEFINDNSVAVVPINWLAEVADQDFVCCWPPLSQSKDVGKLVKEGVEPELDWTQYSVRVLHKYGTCSCCIM